MAYYRESVPSIQPRSISRGGIELPSKSRVARIYERHVRPLSPEERLELLAMVAQGLATRPGSAAKAPRRSIMELRGLGKEIWGGVDAQDYVNELRDEWDRQAS